MTSSADQMWDAVGHDADAEAAEKRLAVAKVKVAPLLGFLAAAADEGDFDARLRLAAERVEAVVFEVSPDDHVLLGQVTAGLRQDWQVLASSRTASDPSTIDDKSDAPGTEADSGEDVYQDDDGKWRVKGLDEKFDTAGDAKAAADARDEVVDATGDNDGLSREDDPKPPDWIKESAVAIRLRLAAAARARVRVGQLRPKRADFAGPDQRMYDAAAAVGREHALAGMPPTYDYPDDPAWRTGYDESYEEGLRDAGHDRRLDDEQYEAEVGAQERAADQLDTRTNEEIWPRRAVRVEDIPKLSTSELRAMLTANPDPDWTWRATVIGALRRKAGLEVAACRKCSRSGRAGDGSSCDYCDGNGSLTPALALAKDADGWRQGLVREGVFHPEEFGSARYEDVPAPKGDPEWSKDPWDEGDKAFVPGPSPMVNRADGTELRPTKQITERRPGRTSARTGGRYDDNPYAPQNTPFQVTGPGMPGAGSPVPGQGPSLPGDYAPQSREPELPKPVDDPAGAAQRGRQAAAARARRAFTAPPGSVTALVDRMAADVMSTNPGLSAKQARDLAEESVRRSVGATSG